MMRDPQHGSGSGHGQGHENDEFHRLDRIEKSVGRQEKAWQRNEPRLMEALGAIEFILERIKQMPVTQEIQDALDAVKAELSTKAAAEHEQFLAAMQAQSDVATGKIDALQAKIDELIAKGSPPSADDLAAIKGLAADVDTAVDAIVP